MEGALKHQLTKNIATQYINSKKLRNASQRSYKLPTTCFPTILRQKSHFLSISRTKHSNQQVKVYAARRRRSNTDTDTYVLMEPGKNEEFVSEDELRIILKNWLENWPGKALPPDLSRFESTDEAVSYLVKSVCELEIDGDVGSIQWFQVRLE